MDWNTYAKSAGSSALTHATIARIDVRGFGSGKRKGIIDTGRGYSIKGKAGISATRINLRLNGIVIKPENSMRKGISQQINGRT